MPAPPLHSTARRLTIAMALLATLAGSACLAQDKPRMTWLILDLPPVSMPVNGAPTVGVTDTLLKLIVAEWTDVSHHYVISNTARALAMLAEGQEACFNSAVITPERERATYLAPTHFGIPLQLITRKEVVTKLPRNAAGEVLPGNLFDSSGLRGLIVRNRSYSPVLDALLNMRSSQSALGYAIQADGGSNIFKMIALGRADYTIEYDFALAYQLQREPGFYADKDLVALPLAGTRPFESGIACPRTAWGRETIRKIDSIVAKLASRKDYRTASDRWLTPGTVERYKAARQQFFDRRTHLSPAARFD